MKDVKDARDQYEAAESADSKDRAYAKYDMKFTYEPDGQWDDDVRTKREKSNRPCLTFNQLPVFIDQVSGDLRMNHPGIEVIPYDDKADPEIARTYQGLIRNIEAISNADVAYTHATETAAVCGRGFFRLITLYEDDSFNQEIRIKPILDPFMVTWDPSSQELDLSDSEFMFLRTQVSRKAFKKKYPDIEPLSFAGEIQGWCDEDNVVVAEWFEKEPVTKTIYMLPDGAVVEAVPPGITPLKSRKIKTDQIVWRLITGNEIIEEKKVWPSQFYPIIPVWGKIYVSGGKIYRRGLVRYATDAQKMYNYNRTLSAEAIALAPKAPWMATNKQVKNYLDLYERANEDNIPILLYDADPQAPGKPERQFPTQVQTGINAEVQIASGEMRATIGIYESGLGMKSNETSGKAVSLRQAAGNKGTYTYIDNLGRAIGQAGRTMIDIIPKIYDTERIVRILGRDGESGFVPINIQTPEGDILNDITVGKYDVVVRMGPGNQTEREVALEKEMQLCQYVPGAVPQILDLLVKDIGGPRSQEISERLKPKEPPPDPNIEIKMKELQLKEQELMLKKQELDIKAAKTTAEIEKLTAEAGGIKLEAMERAKELDSGESIR
jgi:hypothetical protein